MMMNYYKIFPTVIDEYGQEQYEIPEEFDYVQMCIVYRGHQETGIYINADYIGYALDVPNCTIIGDDDNKYRIVYTQKDKRYNIVYLEWLHD